MNRFIYTFFGVLAIFGSVFVSGCSDADVASANLSKAADNFEISRRIVFYNGITGEYILQMEGLCSIGNDRTQHEVAITCKIGPNQYKKNFLGISDNVTWFSEQVESAPGDVYHYRVIWKPSVIVPNLQLK
jgi:hypothetical protein